MVDNINNDQGSEIRDRQIVNSEQRDEAGSREPGAGKVRNDTSKKKKLFLKKCKNCGKILGEMEEYKRGWQRAQADYKNLQREISEQRSEWARMSEQQILEEFIPVYDNFKKAFAAEQRTENRERDGWVKGIEYIMKQFGDVLKTHDVEEIKTVGEKFDPKLHEAVSEEESNEEEETILKEVNAGYMMGGKVIKVARVVVAK